MGTIEFSLCHNSFSEDSYTDPFCLASQKVFRLEIDPAHGAFVDLLINRKLDFRPIDSPTGRP